MSEPVQNPPPPTSIEALSEAVRAQARTLETIKQEVDALQVAEKHRHKAWYQDTPAIVAALALFFSVVTSAFSYYASLEREELAARSELRDLILKLGRFPRENFENQLVYANDQNARDQISGLMQAEAMVLSGQAYALAEQIPNRVTASEHLAIAIALLDTRQFGKALDHYSAAAAKATSIDEIAPANRGLAAIAFMQGLPEEGRQKFQEAKDSLDREPFSEELLPLREDSKAWTEVHWAEREMLMGECQAAMRHLESAKAHLAQAAGPGVPRTAAVLAELERIGCQNAPSVDPLANPDIRIATEPSLAPTLPAAGGSSLPPNWIDKYLLPSPDQ